MASLLHSAMAQAIAAALAALAVGTAATGIRPSEADHLWRLLGPVAPVLAIPAVWILLQAVPMPIPGFANPVWSSAATALGRSVLGSISIDPGDTLLGLARYLTFAGMITATTIASLDRRRAEWVLFWLTGICTLMSAVSITRSFDITVIGVPAGLIGRAAPTGAGVLGTIVAACAIICTVERRETRCSSEEGRLNAFGPKLAVFVAALAICWLSLANRPAAAFAAVCGTAAVVLIQATRRFALSPWMSATMAIVAIALASAFAVDQQGSARDLTLRFATNAPPTTISLAARVIADARWTGAGAGTFASLIPIYRDPDEASAVDAPTTASAVAIELGRPSLLIAVMMMIGATAFFIRAALRRGRDSFYAAAGAACALAMTVEAFADATAIAPAPQIIAAAILGLALGQSVSRTAPR